MRVVVLLLALSLLLPLHTVRAQEHGTRLALPSLEAAPFPPAALAAPAHDPFASSATAGRDRGKGALYGLGIGALVGGVGFATVHYLATSPVRRSSAYTQMSFATGAVVGGAAGAVLGAIIGVPEKEESPQLRLYVAPAPSHPGSLEVSVSLRSR